MTRMSLDTGTRRMWCREDEEEEEGGGGCEPDWRAGRPRGGERKYKRRMEVWRGGMKVRGGGAIEEGGRQGNNEKRGKGIREWRQGNGSVEKHHESGEQRPMFQRLVSKGMAATLQQAARRAQ